MQYQYRHVCTLDAGDDPQNEADRATRDTFERNRRAQLEILVDQYVQRELDTETLAVAFANAVYFEFPCPCGQNLELPHYFPVLPDGWRYAASTYRHDTAELLSTVFGAKIESVPTIVVEKFYGGRWLKIHEMSVSRCFGAPTDTEAGLRRLIEGNNLDVTWPSEMTAEEARDVTDRVAAVVFETDSILTCEHTGCYMTGTVEELVTHVAEAHPEGIVRDQ